MATAPAGKKVNELVPVKVGGAPQLTNFDHVRRAANDQKQIVVSLGEGSAERFTVDTVSSQSVTLKGANSTRVMGRREFNAQAHTIVITVDANTPCVSEQASRSSWTTTYLPIAHSEGERIGGPVSELWAGPRIKHEKMMTIDGFSTSDAAKDDPVQGQIADGWVIAALAAARAASPTRGTYIAGQYFSRADIENLISAVGYENDAAVVALSSIAGAPAHFRSVTVPEALAAAKAGKAVWVEGAFDGVDHTARLEVDKDSGKAFLVNVWGAKGYARDRVPTSEAQLASAKRTYVVD